MLVERGGGEWKMGSGGGEWKMENEKWKMGSGGGERKMENEKWKMGSGGGERKMENEKWGDEGGNYFFAVSVCVAAVIPAASLARMLTTLYSPTKGDRV